MAANSLREQLILDVKSSLESISSIAHVDRRKLSFDELETVPATQLPYVVVMGDLPIPKYKFEGRSSASIGAVISELTINLTVYGSERENPDSAISSLLDDIWVKMFEDPTRSGLAIKTTLYPSPKYAILDPYYAFEVDVIVTYKHTTNSI